MADLEAKENARLSEQRRLDAGKTAEERNQWGQFATPPRLAQEILEYAATLAGSVRFLDPALGTGSFYSALRHVFGSERIEAATGIELDPAFAETARRLWSDTGLEVVQGDFTCLKPRPSFSLIVANPPYVRHHHLDAADKARLQSLTLSQQGIRISGLAGLYCYFLLLSDAWLQPDGLSIWLVPSEFMDVNYGHAIRSYLTERVQLLHIHRFRPADVQFADALVSSVVVVFRKRRPDGADLVKMSLGGALSAPECTAMVPVERLRTTRKWTASPVTPIDRVDGHAITLGDLFAIKRGIATGANGFFILPEDVAAREGVPEEFCKPILPNPRRLTTEIVESDEHGRPANIVRLGLLDCSLPEEVIEQRYPQFWRYLQRGKQEHIDTTYLTSRRTPWYSQEKRAPAPFLFTYMGRSANGRRPFRVIWNKSAATAHNVYLLLYPRDLLRTILESHPEAQEAVFRSLQAIDLESLLKEGRVYGGGLHKLEPRELARVPATEIWEAVTRLVPLACPSAPARQLMLGW